jgi:hypothetical protein
MYLYPALDLWLVSLVTDRAPSVPSAALDPAPGSNRDAG